jgi:hypothetical protein
VEIVRVYEVELYIGRALSDRSTHAMILVAPCGLGRFRASNSHLQNTCWHSVVKHWGDNVVEDASPSEALKRGSRVESQKGERRRSAS